MSVIKVFRAGKQHEGLWPETVSLDLKREDYICEGDRFVRYEDYAAATQWRPIETAPKDGTEVLLACVGHDNLKIGVKMHKEDTGSDLLNSCYVIVSSGAACQPTHWMPLPKPPTV